MNADFAPRSADEPAVIVMATLDTKGAEAAYVRELLAGYGLRIRLADVGCGGASSVAADISRKEILAALESGVEQDTAREDRGAAVAMTARAAAAWTSHMHARGCIEGLLALGGSAGTTIGAAAMRALPIGVPKILVSTLASGQVRHYVGDQDILMLNSVVDLAGINRITRQVLGQAARAMAGMVLFERREPSLPDRPLVAATMFGVTTPCVEQARARLEQDGYEVLVFHATGSGGQAMESLIEQSLFAGVLDITTTELADELVGGLLSAGPDRLTAAARRGVPQVVSVGATDMVNFHAPESVPEKFAGRKFYRHNPNVTLMRTTVDENARIGADIGHKLSASRGPVCVLLPAEGVSAIDRAAQPFDDPVARRALFAAIRQHGPTLDVREFDCHINEGEFAIAAAERLLELMRQQARRG